MEPETQSGSLPTGGQPGSQQVSQMGGLSPKHHPYAIAMRWFMLSGVVALVGLGGWLGYDRWLKPKPPTVAVSLVPAQRGDVEITITESGTVVLAEQQTLTAPREVTVEQVLVQAGQRVKAGQTLIVLRDRQAQQDYQDQQIENQKDAITLARKQEAVAEKRAKVKTANDRYQASQELFQKGFISEDEVQTDRDRVEDAAAALKDAQTEQVRAELDVKKGQIKLRDIQRQLGDRLVLAPIEGLVLGLAVKPGDGVKTETSLLTLGDPTKELVRLQLTTLNAAKVNLNQLARIRMIGPNPKQFRGRVLSLSPQATASNDNQGGSSQNQAKVDATVVLDRPSGSLIPGSQVSVEIVLQQRRNVVTLPVELIQPGDNPFVWLRDPDGLARRRSVSLGLQGLTQVEVTTGLQPGDPVVSVPPTQTISPGTRLEIAPNGQNPLGQTEATSNAEDSP